MMQDLVGLVRQFNDMKVIFLLDVWFRLLFLC